MHAHYNRIAGGNLDRLSGLSDGVFSIAMTLLVLELHTPAHAAIHDERGLWLALVDLAPKIVVFALSFMTLGIFWVGQQTQLNHLARSNRDLSWLHLAFLGGVSLMPFSTALMGEFVTLRLALLVYWLNILALGALLLLAWRLATRHKLLGPGAPAGLDASIQRRILVSQGLYAAATALCVINTYWSLGLIVLIQLNYAVAPRIPFLNRL